LSNSTKLAHSLLRQLIELGISDFVVSPGSRNAPLLIALGEAAQKQVIDLHTKIDERGAAFFALGISKASNNYVAVVCTSGTAAANYLPAALEALHGRSKLLIITADRPARLRKTGANQTTNQVNLFQGISTHDFSSDIDIEPLLKSGPVHLNVQFDEPLVSAEKTDWLAGLRVSPRSYDNQVNGKLESTTGVLVVGHDSVVVIGRTTLSRSTNNFIKLAKNLIVIDPRTKDIDSKREGNLILSQLPNEVVSQKSNAPDWQIASDLTANIITELEWSEQLAIVNICKSIPTQSSLFIGSSRPVRDVEAFCKPRSGVQVLANRGLAGIDGNISTVFGIATEFESNYAILGDLTFLHDISALTNRTDQNVRIYVINNNGGGIFYLEPPTILI